MSRHVGRRSQPWKHKQADACSPLAETRLVQEAENQIGIKKSQNWREGQERCKKEAGGGRGGADRDREGKQGHLSS